MQLVHDADREVLRSTVRKFVAARMPMSTVRSSSETPEGYDREIWQQMAQELGLQGLAVPEQFGGSGMGFVEVGIVCEELGRGLAGVPYLSTAVMATELLLACDDASTQAALLPPIAAGDITVAVGHDGGSSINAVELAGGWLLDGGCSFVLDGMHADHLLLFATTPAGLAVFHVEGSAPGLRRTALETMDQTRRQATLALAGCRATLVGAVDTGATSRARLLDRTLIAVACEQLGGAARVLELSVRYATDRFQFGRPIGGFQAVKHTCADMLIAVEQARAAVMYACWAAQGAVEDLPVAASLASLQATAAFTRAAGDTIQLHGGIGFTWEHDAHLYFKRATSTALLFGDAPRHRRRLALELGLVEQAS